MPTVTVGVMAYNEEAHLVSTLDSILRQGYQDYEVIIADNASDDSTPEIAQRYARTDPRVRHFRQSRNIGAILNFHTLVEQAQGQYFVLAGAHDLWSDNYLEHLVAALETEDQAVLAYGRTVWVDERGQRQDRAVSFLDTSGLSPLARFNITLWGNQHALYGMYRLSTLRQCRTNLLIIGNGAVLLGELALRGYFIVVPETTWFRRLVREPETTDQRLKRYFSVLFPNRRHRFCPHWRIPFEYIRAVLQSPLSMHNKLLAIICCGSVFIIQRRNMISDLASLVSRTIRLKWHGAAPWKKNADKERPCA